MPSERPVIFDGNVGIMMLFFELVNYPVESWALVFNKEQHNVFDDNVSFRA
jgi:hypothetical protein